MGFIGRYVDKKRIEKIIPFLNKKFTILDLGCGDGWFTKYLNSNDYNCVGVDVDIETHHPFYNGSAYKIPFPDNYFDCLIMFEVVEHIKPSSYKEINRVLKTGGKIILSTIIPESDWFVHILSKLHLADPYVTPHINLVHINKELPWKLIHESRILLLDQFGVFQKNEESDSFKT